MRVLLFAVEANCFAEKGRRYFRKHPFLPKDESHFLHRNYFYNLSPIIDGSVVKILLSLQGFLSRVLICMDDGINQEVLENIFDDAMSLLQDIYLHNVLIEKKHSKPLSENIGQLIHDFDILDYGIVRNLKIREKNFTQLYSAIEVNIANAEVPFFEVLIKLFTLFEVYIDEFAVWKELYISIVDTPNEKLNKAYCDLLKINNIYYKEPKQISDYIIEIINNFNKNNEIESKLPKQNEVGVNFQVSDCGLISTIVENRNIPDVKLSERQLEYEELLFKANSILNEGENRCGFLYPHLLRFLLLPKSIKECNPKIFWSRINSLRQVLENHELAQLNLNHQFLEGKLEETIAIKLKDLIHTINVFIFDDDELLVLERNRVGPNEVSHAKNDYLLVKNFIDDVINDGKLVDEKTAEIMREQLDNIENSTNTNSSEKAIIFAAKTNENFIVTALRGAIKFVGKESAYGVIRGGIAAIIQKNWQNISQFIANHYGELVNIISRIINMH